SVDQCPGYDDATDTDADGVPNGCDDCSGDLVDGDADGVADACDPCPLDNPDDSDADTVCDSSDACPGADDAVDGDLDTVPDACDVCPLDNPDDSDADGVCNSVDQCVGFDDAIDTDADGIPNGCDICAGGDTDGDGVQDECDACPDDNPDDTDLDAVCDSDDECPGFDDGVDTDGDGLPDGCDAIASGWIVDCGGGGDFVTIQTAIDASISGDSIAVQPCEYHERIDFRAKVLNIYGTGGSGLTVIDGDSVDTVVRVVSGESLGTRLAGFTIRGGDAGGPASAIEVDHSSLHLEDIVLSDNDYGSAVLDAYDSYVTADGLTIENNDVGSSGAGINSHSGALTLHDANVDCSGGEYAVYQHNSANVDGSTFTCVGGYGWWSHHSDIRMRRSSFVGTLGGLHAEEEVDSDPVQKILLSNIYAEGEIGLDVRWFNLQLDNAVVSGSIAGLNVEGLNVVSEVTNTIFYESGCGIQGDGAVLDVQYSDGWGNTTDLCNVVATLTYSADPQFVGYPDDLTLGAGSALIDAGDPNEEDPDGSRSDVGAYGGADGAW
ncbi:MAG: hypothetical protein H0V89_12410, partial [Deltaproteobacteria bacterium]|nr:hypothetical protein [Deltaproteobacteria bacterium]